MATKNAYEFQCPQFVDFTEVDSSPKDAAEFGGFSPDLANPALNISATRRKVYPDLKKILPLRQTPICLASNKTDSDKWHLTTLSKRLSKSDGAINHFSRNPKASTNVPSHFSAMKRLNRSLSENDVRVKARTHPTTPVCLKRTLHKMKAKKFKTSEELELEKIAQLQKQMRQHLRANEIAMKRLKMKPRSCTALKEFPKPEMKSMDNLKVQIPKVKLSSNSFEKVTDSKGLGKLDGQRRNLSPPSARVGLDVNGNKAERAKRFMSRVNELRRTVCSQNLNGVLASMSDADGLSSIKTKKIKPYTAHHGLMFLPNNRKVTTLEAFNFSGKESQHAQSFTLDKNIPIKDQRQAPGTHYNFTGKENMSQKSYSERKRRTPFHSTKDKI